MIYHDILGINENASATDIDNAYEKKIAVLEGQRVQALMNQQQFDKKAHELFIAKESCLSWRDKSFTDKTAEKVQKYSSTFFSNGHMNEVCCGPCTFVDALGGFLCTCNSSDSLLVGCCGCRSPWLAILIDIVFYAYFGFTFYASHEQTRIEGIKAADEAIHQKIIEDTKRELATLRTQFSDLTGKLESLSRVYQETELNTDTVKRMSALFALMGSEFDFAGFIQLSEKQLDAAKADCKSAEAEKARIEQKIASLSKKLE